MARLAILAQLGALLVLLLAAGRASAIKFDLPARTPEYASEHRKCLFTYVPHDTLVVVTVKVGDGYNQKVDMEIFDHSPQHNEYGRRRDLTDARVAFNTHADSEVSVCFTNTLDEGFKEDPKYKRSIDLVIDVGAEAVESEKLAKAEKLRPMEVELRKLETVAQEIVDEMEYLKSREAARRDTNESTNSRVKWFSILSIATLISLGTWQILYLRRFFKRKRLID
ncbi:uncharacterized protein VTP21DRAFT_5088 [Calcarisporiella thermophila]|uniref:uncharacterized protein n=1 Tax=Calcarisporiella thermophila TaxID=911321 RepID=UPI003742E1A9